MRESPRSRVTRPVLMVLTSHRKDCFDLCVWCLEQFTELTRFKAIYILANAVSPEHGASIAAFVARHKHAQTIACLPQGLVPAVMVAQNAILARHADDGVVKIDEDVFVTPYWLDHLLAANRRHANDPNVLLVGCPTPVSVTGKRCLGSFFRAHCPELIRRCAESRVYDDPLYHRLVWEAVLTGNMLEAYRHFAHPPYFLVRSLIIHCVLYDRKALDAIGSFPVQAFASGEVVTDELAVNIALRRTGAKAALPSAGLVHHYSHAGCLEAMLRDVPMTRLWEWMRGQIAVAPACSNG